MVVFALSKISMMVAPLRFWDCRYSFSFPVLLRCHRMHENDALYGKMMVGAVSTGTILIL